MDNYATILSRFVEFGYSQSSALDEYQLYKVLDKIYQKSTDSEELFNRDVAQEIFEQTPKNSGHEVKVKDYISTILEAHILLKRYIHEHRDKMAMADGNERGELITQLRQYEEDYYLLTEPFGIKNGLKDEAGIPDSRISKSSNMSDIFAEPPKVGNDSQSLKITLVTTLSCFLLEFFLMFQKQHFLSMLTYVAVLSIFLLNYFDKTYIRITLYMLIISIFLDFLWVILMADHYWNAEGASHRSNQQTGFLRFVYIMTVITMIAKGVVTFLLFKYRSNTQTTCKTVRLFNLRFELSAEVPSPLSNLIMKSV